MRIGVIQIRPVAGEIEKNIADHLRLLAVAVSNHLDFVIFPELSLTGYEPALAKEVALKSDDALLSIFQRMSEDHRITIGVGAPLETPAGITISLILFRPAQERLVYSKHYLHPDELEYFVSGENFPVLKVDATNIALAICYELSIEEHARRAANSGAHIYVASVAKFESGVVRAHERLREIAVHYKIPVMMANSIGPADNGICAGMSGVWDHHGQLIGQLDERREGLLAYDTQTGAILSLVDMR